MGKLNKPSASWPSKRTAIVMLVFVQVAIIFIVRPAGNFPVNDDWAYAASVKWLLEDGHVRIHLWSAMNLLPQTLAGGIASLMFGFSFEVLRHLTQIIAMLASAAAFLWFRTADLEPLDALIATLAVISFPAWPVLANSYMTDIYGLLLGLTAASLFFRALDTGNAAVLVSAAVVAAIGMLQRQVVLVLPLGFFVAWICTNPWTRRNFLIALMPLVSVVAAQVLYQTYLSHGPGLPEGQRIAHDQVLSLLPKIFSNEDRHAEQVLHNALSIVSYLGLFSAGWALWWGWGGVGRLARVAIVLGGTAISCVALAVGWLPPYRGNMVMDAAGIGPFTLYDSYMRGTSIQREPGLVWRAAGVAASFGAAALCILLWESARRLWTCRLVHQRRQLFLLVAIGAYLFPFVAVNYFDRYLLFVLPLIFALWSITWPRRERSLGVRSVTAALLIVVLICASSIATHDYFAWNRARWAAIQAAHELGASPDTLDGGYEYNALHRSDGKLREPPPGKSWWWVRDDEFIVAFIVVPGYREVHSFPVDRWLRRTPAVVRLLRRE